MAEMTATLQRPIAQELDFLIQSSRFGYIFVGFQDSDLQRY